MLDKAILASQTTLIGNSAGGGKVGQTISVRVQGRPAIRAKCITNVPPGQCVLMLSNQGWIVAGSSAKLLNERVIDNRIKKTDLKTSDLVAAFLFTKETENTIQFWVGGDRKNPVLITEIPKQYRPELYIEGSLSGSGSHSVNFDANGVYTDAIPIHSVRVSSKTTIFASVTGVVNYTGDSDPNSNDNIPVFAAVEALFQKATAIGSGSSETLQVINEAIAPGCREFFTLLSVGTAEIASSEYNDVTASGTASATYSFTNNNIAIANGYEAWISRNRGAVKGIIKHQPRFDCGNEQREAFEKVITFSLSNADLLTLNEYDYSDFIELQNDWRDSFYNYLRQDSQDSIPDSCVNTYRFNPNANIDQQKIITLDFNTNLLNQLRQEGNVTEGVPVNTSIYNSQESCILLNTATKLISVYSVGPAVDFISVAVSKK